MCKRRTKGRTNAKRTTARSTGSARKDGSEWPRIPVSFCSSPCAQSSVPSVLVMGELIEPKFEMQPKGQVIKAGEILVLECAANGQPEPDIRWTKDQKPLDIAARYSLFRCVAAEWSVIVPLRLAVVGINELDRAVY